jgi:PAS domain S-box-containing protein
MFAGAPILTEGSDIVGVVWVSDHQPHHRIDEHVGELLVALAGNAALRAELGGPRLQEYEHLAEMLQSAAFRCDPKGILEWVSPSWLTLTGFSAETMVGQPLSQYIPGKPDNEGSYSFPGPTDELTHRAHGSLLVSGGSSVPVLVILKRIRVQEHGGGAVLGVVTDIREQQQRELGIRHDQKLESLGRLSAGIAHEINTPIQFVGDNTRFLASAYQEMLNLLFVYRECMDSPAGGMSWNEHGERARKAEQKADIDYLAAEVPAAVEQSLEGIERVASLVRAMKSFSYKDANDRSYSDLNEALRTTLTVARNEVKYVADVILDLGDVPDVLCHVGDLNQVFLNLLVNAADAIGEQDGRGEIRISTRTEGSTVVIAFTDTGCGIPEDIRQVIFEPFFTTKEVGKGTGQGLALARTVVHEKHGGTIEVHPGATGGTAFVLRLPIDGKGSKGT